MNPTVTAEAVRQGLTVGGAYDLKTGYNLRHTKDLAKMWRELREDDPELVVGSPPCRPFSILQSLNYPKMDFLKAVDLVGDGLAHIVTTCAFAKWQHRRGKKFLIEHPRGSRAWSEPEMVELANIWRASMFAW